MNLLLKVSNYITRYAPSEKRLKEYINKKKPTFPTDSFLKEIGFEESMMIDMWIRTFLSGSKGEQDIRYKLMKKGFPKDLIEEKIQENISYIRSWEDHTREIESQIDTLLKKGKSKQMILLTLGKKYPYFRDEIKEMIQDQDEHSGLQKELEKYLLKYDISDFSERQKIFSALQRKGFSYTSIQSQLSLRDS